MNMNQEMKGIVIVEKPDLQFTDLNGNKIRMISVEDETYLEEKAQELINFMRNNHSQDLSDGEKDLLYSELQVMWNEVSGRDGGKLNDTSFHLVLHRPEYNYLVSLLREKLLYDVDTIFFAMELDNMVQAMLANSKFPDDKTAMPFNMTPVDVHYLYQLISKHTVKGLKKESYYFAEVIKRVALSSRIFNYYKETYANIAKAIQMWVASLDKGVAIQEGDSVYELIWGDSDVKPNFITDTTDVKDVKDVVDVVDVADEQVK